MNRAAIGITVRLVVRLYFIHKILWLRQPLPRLGGMTVIEVVNGRFHERLAKPGHHHLSVHVSDHRASFNVGKMFDVELEFLPDGCGFPAMETSHVEQHAQLSMLLDRLFKLRHETFVVGPRQNPADVNR